MFLKNMNKYFDGSDTFSCRPGKEVTKKLFFLAVTMMFGMLSIFLAYRQLIFNSFSMLPGDRYDMVIMSAILEHWKNVWAGYSQWHDVGYFYPYTRTIAQTDGYFLIGVIFSFIRIFVNDIFLSVVLTTITLSGIGFISIYILTRRKLAFRFETSLLISCVFVLFSSLVSHNQRLQLMSVYFLPVLTIFLLNYLHGVNQKYSKLSTTLSGCAFGLFYGAMTITCFYIAWFYALFLMIVFIVFAFSKPKIILEWFKIFVSLKSASFVVFVVFVVSLLPFVWAYYPKSLEVGVRNYSSVSENLIVPLELIQVGFDNYIYGVLLRHVFAFFYPGYQPWGEYYNVGFSPLIFGLFIVALFCFSKKTDDKENSYFFLTGVSALIGCFLVVKINGFSLWYYVYSFIPGAQALNAVSVFLMVLSLPVLIVVGKYIDTQKFTKSFLVVLSLVIIIGELTTPYLHFNRKVEDRRIVDIPAPPESCHVFYVSNFKGQMTIPDFPEWVNSMYAHNVTAMMISQIIKLPTINGVASFNPRDWNFAAPWDKGYDERVFVYAKKHGVNSLCKFDLNNKTWTELKAFSEK
ncbi:hypothetical protein [Pantoea ananatis]|uniref:hypothetical protein n=1 Tax=Pantoea ananas TaxID=553 RepID=UPI001B30E83A|nr:hypothetical protein [Pantoea ananatis]